MERPQLFCVPYAGGTAKFFGGLAKELAPCCDVYPLEYAGHGLRSAAPLYPDFEALRADVAEQIAGLREPGRPYLLFGYSMGALIVYDYLLGHQEADPPAHVFLAAHEPPNIPFRGSAYAELSDDDLVAELNTLGGINESLLRNKRFLSLYLRPIRRDYQLISSYVWDGRFRRLHSDLTVFHSREDTNFEYVEQWKEHTTGRTVFLEYPGKHFFLKDHEAEIAADIVRVLQEKQLAAR